MSLNTRRFLYIIFLLAFLTITPILILYAAGYKLGSGFNVEKTGMLIIDTKPSSAKVYINGKLQKKFFKNIFSDEENLLTTPIKIKGLLPGEYNIKLELNNYWPWEKKLKIISGQSTFIEDVTFFKIDLPLILKKGDHDNIELSPDNKFLIADKKNVVSRIKLLDNSIVSHNSSSTQGTSLPDKIAWSPDGQKAIINDHLFHINKWSKPESLNELLGENVKNVKWNTKKDGNLYYSYNNSISYYNISKDESKNVISGKEYFDYLPRENYLFIVEKKDNKISLNAYNINKGELSGKTDLPDSEYEFINHGNRLINLYDKEHEILYLIDPFSNIKPLRETINNIKTANWISESRLIFANDFEIWHLDMGSQTRTLITRVSQKINEIFWHPSNNYIIYAADNGINIIELDNRDKYNITRLIELETIENVTINKKGDTIYFQSKIGNQEGVYSLPIQ